MLRRKNISKKAFNLIVLNPIFIYYLLISTIALLIPDTLYAHEQWFLNPNQMDHLNKKPAPIIFSQLTLVNVAIFLFSMLCIYGWILLGRQGGRELFSDHQLRLSSYGKSAALVLRYATALMLLMAAVGFNTRSGVAPFTSPTLIFPDLQLSLLSDNWMWLKWVEIAIAAAFLLGTYVRAFATALLVVGFLGLYLYGWRMLYYIGFVTGISLYLIFQGAGLFYIKLPTIIGMKRIHNWLLNQPIGRSQFLLRVLVGASFAYTGFLYKFIHPNLAISLLTIRQMPTFGLNIETVVFWMAIIETFSGVLLVIGALTRPVAFILLGCFVFMGFAVDEPLYAHTIFFGALIACYINGAGQWRQPPAKDKAANIVILGASISAIACVKKLENLLGNVTNVKISIVHNENYVQYDPLLPEVISGKIQPGNIINSIRRLFQTERFIQGEVKSIDQHQVEVALLSGKRHFLPYDQLIIAYGKFNEYSTIPGFEQYSIPIKNVGDALCIRRNLLDCFEKAEFTEDPAIRQRLLTFTVIGGGLRGTSVAAEIKGLIKSALIYYPKIHLDEIKIYLLDRHQRILPLFNQKVAAEVHHQLSEMKINIKCNVNILMLTSECVFLTSGEQIPCYTKISALSKQYPIHQLFKSNVEKPFTLNDKLEIEGIKNVFVTGMIACYTSKIPLQTLYEVKLGQLAAYNAWANSQGFKLHHWKLKKELFSIASLGQNASSVQLGRFIFKGPLAWVTSHMVCLIAMPGLEKNFRVLLDWALNFLFRRDIVGFSMSQTSQPVAKEIETIENDQHKTGLAYLLHTRNFAILRNEIGETNLIFGFAAQQLSWEIQFLQSIICFLIKGCHISHLSILDSEQYTKLIAEINLQKCQAIIIDLDKKDEKVLENA